MITIILGAKNPKGETAFFLKYFLKGLSNTELSRFQIFFCDKITRKDHVKILKSEKIIIFTPTYWFGIPSRLQKFIEDFACLEEDKFNFLEGKKFACVAYSPHGGDTECITKLGLTFNGWGCEIVSCGLMYFRSTTEFHKNHWSLKDLKTLSKKFNK